MIRNYYSSFTGSRSLRRFLLIVFMLNTSIVSFAANRYWVATSSGNWNSSSNWSNTSGGSGGASFPVAGDVAIFDGAGGANGACNIVANVSVSGISITSGYTNTISQGSNSITIGATGAILSGGTFAGGSGTISIGGVFTINGTLFTSTTSTLTLTNALTFTLSSGAFNHNNGTVIFSTSNNTTSGNITFNHLTFANNSGGVNTFAIGAGETLTVLGTLSTSGANSIVFNTGTISAKGDINIGSVPANGGGSATISIDGTGNQNMTSSVALGQGRLPVITINKSSGTLFMSGIFTAENDWNYIAGTVDAGTSKVVFIDAVSVTGNLRLNDVEFANSSGGPVSYTIANTLTVAGTLSITGANSVLLNSGTVEALGDVTVNNAGTNGGSTGTLLFNGTGNQTLTGSGVIGEGRLPLVNINKTSGTLYLASVISTSNNWTYTSGTLDPGTSKVAFIGALTITGSHILYDIEFPNSSGGGYNYTIASGTTLTASGTIYISGANSVNINTGILEALGDVTITNTSTAGGGNGTLLFAGTGTQTLTGSGTVGQGRLPRVNINKTSGVLNLASVISTVNNWTYTSGTVNAGTSRVCFLNALTIAGSHTLYDVEFFATGGANNFVITSGTTLTSSGTIYITGNSGVIINTGTLEALGDVTITNTATSGGGNGTLLISGTGTQTLTGPGVIGQGRLPLVNINKASDVLNLVSIISTINHWTYTSGTVNAGTSRVCFLNALTITGSHTLYDVEFYATGGANNFVIASGTTLTASGTIYITGNSGVSINTGTLEALGDVTITNVSTGGGGNGTLLIDGSGTQTMTGPGVVGQGRLPLVNINKTSGTLNLVSVISTLNHWTYISGTINAGTSKVAFLNALTITGSHTLYDVEFYASGGTNNFTIASGTTLTSSGTITISGNSGVVINTGTLEALGDITITNISTGGGGNGTLLISGTGTQTFTGPAAIGQGRLPLVHINKSSGVLNLVNILSTMNHWTYTSGTINAGTSTVAFLNALTITGSHTLANVEFTNATGGVRIITIASGTVLGVSATTTVSGTNSLSFNTGTVNSKGDLIVTNNQPSGGGTATFLIDGTATQAFTSSAPAGNGKLPNIVIDKTGGALNMSGIINVVGSWTYNNGTVNAGTSEVNFTTANSIDGKGSSSTMSFYKVTLGDNTLRTLQGDIIVSDVLALGSGRISMNGNTITMTLNATGAITRSTGYIISENTSNANKIIWNIGATTGSYVYPFATASGTYIPFTFQLTAGDAGNVTISTYPTISNNTPYPVTPDAVTNMSNGYGVNVSSNVIDRFWQIDKSGATATATLTYVYAQAEVSGGVTGNEALLVAQRYNTSINAWDAPLASQTANATTNTLVEPNVTQFSPRTLALSSAPLPVILVSFKSQVGDALIILDWSTASENNSAYFIVERSHDGINFESIGKVNAAGNTSVLSDYSFIDKNALSGNNYYKLQQVDLDGKTEYSNVIVVFYDVAGIASQPDVVIYPNPTQHGSDFTIDLTGFTEDVLIVVKDIHGNDLAEKITVHIHEEHIVTSSQLSEELAPGIYFIVASSNNNIVNRKLIVR